MSPASLKLPVKPPLEPMEALSADAIPSGAEWHYEPKWDGFRAIAFRDGKTVYLQSKAGQPLGQYFPEIVNGLLALPVSRFVLDGELIVTLDDQLVFDELLQRIHPAESRIQKLSKEHPATYVLFDCLLDAKGHSSLDKPLKERRRLLEQFAKKIVRPGSLIQLSPRTERLREAKRWFKKLAGGLDGVIAKRLDAVYEPGERSGAVQKIKNKRTADCVVGGFRYAEKKYKGQQVVGSLSLLA